MRLAALTLLVSAGAAFADCQNDQVEFRGPDGSSLFTVEVADTAETRARGLMFRKTMDDDNGMLFVYPRQRPVAFWMKNTFIPLDMIFVDETGVVKSVHANAIPHDTTAIPSGAPVQYVVEINAGLAATKGIAEGAEMRHPVIDPARAVWQCD